jgi:hypothetical protein
MGMEGVWPCCGTPWHRRCASFNVFVCHFLFGAFRWSIPDLVGNPEDTTSTRAYHCHYKRLGDRDVPFAVLFVCRVRPQYSRHMERVAYDSLVRRQHLDNFLSVVDLPEKTKAIKPMPNHRRGRKRGQVLNLNRVRKSKDRTDDAAAPSRREDEG